MTYRIPPRYRPPARYRYPYYRGYRRAGGPDKATVLIAGAVIALAASGGVKAALPAIRHHHAPAATALSAAAAGSAAQLSTAAANVATGQRLAAGYGWGSGSQWSCLDALWTRESGWRMVWNYQGSGAYGIPQSLPASKMASAGPDYMTSPATQIRWGLTYISQAYGTPCDAWGHETSAGWY